MKTARKLLNQRGMKVTLILLFFLLSIGASFAFQVVNRREQEPQKLPWKRPPLNDERNNARDQRHLREKAKESGKYVAAEYPPDLRRFNTIQDLARQADSIIIARAVKNICQLSQNGKTVTIDYEMKVEHSYKGNLAVGETVSVSLPGGLTKFADGTSAEIRTPWFKKMIDRKTYLLFLNGNANRPFTTTGGPRGLFEIPTGANGRKVTSHSMIEGDPMQSYNNTDVIDFLRAVKQSVTWTK